MASINIDFGKVIVGNDEIKEDAKIGIKNNKIVEISKDRLSKSYDEKIDLSDKVAMPGLIDAHVHLNFTGKDEIDVSDLSDEYLTIRGLELARKSLESGVTLLADCTAIRNTVLGLRNAIQDNVTLGPRIKSCGSMITIHGGRGTLGDSYEVTGEVEARKRTRKLILHDAVDFIKVSASGAISSPLTEPKERQLNEKEMKAITEEAHNFNRPVHAHCYGKESITNALNADVDVIVHGQSLTDEHIEVMKKNNKILAPTLCNFYDDGKSEFGSKAEREIKTETPLNFKKALKEGISITMGTDSGMPGTPFGDNTYDLVYMVELGMDEEEAIKAGTLNAAKSLYIENEVGTLEEGKLADMLILNEDPIKDIQCLTDNKTIEKIILNGNLIDHRL